MHKINMVGDQIKVFESKDVDFISKIFFNKMNHLHFKTDCFLLGNNFNEMSWKLKNILGNS